MCKLQIEPLAAAQANSDAPRVYLSKVEAEINLFARNQSRQSEHP